MISTRATLIAATVATGLLASGCAVQQSGGDDQTETTSAPASAPASAGASESAAASASESGNPSQPSQPSQPATPASASAEPVPADTATPSSPGAGEAGEIPCTAEYLSATFSAYRNQDGTMQQSADGSFSGMFQFVNNGPQACTVDGHPDLVKSNGHAQTPVTVSHTLSPGPSRVEIDPGGQAAVYVSWFETGSSNACYHKIPSFEVHLPPRSGGQPPAEEASDVQPIIVDIPMSEMTNCASECNTSAFYVP